MKLDVLKLDGSKAGSIELDAAIFGLTPRSDVLYRMVRWQQAKRRAGTHDTQNRGEVSRSHSKFGKQKGSGGARHGSRNAPIFVGGGVAHGPHPRSYEHGLTKKFRALGLRMALSAKAQAGSLIVLEDANLANPKTKDLKVSLSKLGLENALVVSGAQVDENFALAARNIINLDVLPSVGINVESILKRKTLVLTKDAIEAVNARFAGKINAKAASVETATKVAADAKPAKKAAKKAGDDLTIIEGIGPKIAELFIADGIATFAALAECTVEQMNAVLEKGGAKFNIANPESWAQQSALAAAGKMDELKKLQDELNAGVAKKPAKSKKADKEA